MFCLQRTWGADAFPAHGQHSLQIQHEERIAAALCGSSALCFEKKTILGWSASEKH